MITAEVFLALEGGSELGAPGDLPKRNNKRLTIYLLPIYLLSIHPYRYLSTTGYLAKEPYVINSEISAPKGKGVGGGGVAPFPAHPPLFFCKIQGVNFSPGRAPPARGNDLEMLKIWLVWESGRAHV